MSKKPLHILLFAALAISPITLRTLNAQCPPAGVPGVTCYPIFWTCQPDESCIPYGGWAATVEYECDWPDPSGEGLSSCTYAIAGCSNQCLGYPPSAAAAWKFDPIKIVLSLFPRLHMEWGTSPRDGRCIRRVSHT